MYNIHQFNTLAAIGTQQGQDKVQLIQQRLGHPLFQILKCMFPNVFKGISIENLFVMSVKGQNTRDIPIAPNI